MGNLTDISELMTKSGYGSESEGEDGEAGKVELEDRGTRQSRIKLTEIGPRMELEVIKIEEGLCDGKVLYHTYESRTAEEVKQKDDEMEEKKRLKDERRRIQDENVRKKKALKKMKDDAKKEKKERKKKEWWEKNEEGERKDADDIDDAEYYRQEVGEAPGEEFHASLKSNPKKARNTKRGRS